MGSAVSYALTNSDEKHVGGEPAWDTEIAAKLSDDEFDHHLRASFRYYNYFYSYY
jgi:hypothetical protein